MQFQWDDQKNRANFKKHKIWFEEAQTIWADTKSAEFFDPEHSEKEDRFIRIGFSSKAQLLLVAFCERVESLVIRIISARKATDKEMKDYEKGI